MEKQYNKRDPFAHVNPLTQTQKLKAWLAVPGNKNRTAAEYAVHLKDKTVIQGDFR